MIINLEVEDYLMLVLPRGIIASYNTHNTSIHFFSRPLAVMKLLRTMKMKNWLRQFEE